MRLKTGTNGTLVNMVIKPLCCRKCREFVDWLRNYSFSRRTLLHGASFSGWLVSPLSVKLKYVTIIPVFNEIEWTLVYPCTMVASTPNTSLRVRDYYKGRYSYAYAYSPLPSSPFSVGLGSRHESWS